MAAVAEGRSPSDAAHVLPGRRGAPGVGAPDERADEPRALAVELRPGSLQQDRDQLGGTEMGLCKLLGAR